MRYDVTNVTNLIFFVILIFIFPFCACDAMCVHVNIYHMDVVHVMCSCYQRRMRTMMRYDVTNLIFL